jgi:hypothetical protein
MFYSLIEHALGLKVDFSLALLIVLVFGVLTNTFCATNVSRDGLSALSTKIYPVSPSKIMNAKVVFCMIVSSISVVFSAVLLIALTPLGILNGVVVAVFGIVFSASQILIATRLDLNHACVASGPRETERVAEKTTTKVVSVGLIFAMLVGVSSLFITLFSGTDIGVLSFLNVLTAISVAGFDMSYLLPLAVTLFYFVLATFYYNFRIEDSFNNLVS